MGSINQSKKTDGRKEREMRRVESPEKRRKMKDRLENSNGAIVFFFFLTNGHLRFHYRCLHSTLLPGIDSSYATRIVNSCHKQLDRPVLSRTVGQLINLCHMDLQNQHHIGETDG